MIKFALKCECSAKFEGWFPSNEDYENQLAKGQLLCPMCDSTRVRKDIMAPAVGKKSTARKRGKAKAKIASPAMEEKSFAGKENLD